VTEPQVVVQIIINQLDDNQIQVTWSNSGTDTQILGMLEMAKIVFMRTVMFKRTIEGGGE
jgi:hypothetical protein